jgi:hypothetical protein
VIPVLSLLVRGILCALFCALAACKEKPAAAIATSSAPQYSLERPLEGLPPPSPRDANFRRGVSLELFLAGVEDAQRAPYAAWLDHAARLGATDVELVVQWSQLDSRSVEMAPSAATAVDDGFLGWLMDQAAARKLRVLLTPMIDVEERPSGKRVIAPADHKRWFWSYHRFALHYARIAAAHQACCLAVGWDLPELDASDEVHWRALITDVRKAFKGKLTYGVRPDHLEAVTFWDAVDLVSLVGLDELLADAASHADQKLTALAQRLRAWGKTHDRPLLLTGIGTGAARAAALTPSAEDRALLNEQLDAVRALYRGLQAEPLVAGVYLSLARPIAAYEPAQTASASAEVMRHWYTRSRK